MTPNTTKIIHNIARMAVAQTTAMIHIANSRDNAQPGDPKVGGHPAACSSAAHILGVLHLVLRNPGDVFTSKPHAAPIDHVYQHHLGLFRDRSTPERFLTREESAEVLYRLRQFSQDGEPVLQSYHALSDPDSQNSLPSGSVGLPAVTLAYLALGHRMAETRGAKLPKDAHFWALIGDSESREGSLMECLPDAAERELGSVTWIIDYNRQSLDGQRMCNRDGLTGTDSSRLARSAEANGWRVIDLQHGSIRLALFAKEGGAALRNALETGFTDYEFQTLLYGRDESQTRSAISARLVKEDTQAHALLESLSAQELREFFEDLGGHDPALIHDAMIRSKEHPNRPTVIIAHTIKGWGMSCLAASGNHKWLAVPEEVESLLETSGLSISSPFESFPEGSDEAALLSAQGERLRLGLNELNASADEERTKLKDEISEGGGEPGNFEIAALRNVPMANTQWMWGQIAGRLRRIADTEASDLSSSERQWKALADRFTTISPDVGTSTNLNPVMDNGVFGPDHEPTDPDEHERGMPILRSHEDASRRHVRMDIAEGAALSCVGSLGLMEQQVGVRFLPAVTLYDFFVKRALDQLFYNLYSGASFLVLGTPSGVSLSSEGAQHCWKSDFQIPGMITWEPSFSIELDWIVHESLVRMATGNDAGRNGVLLRLVTRGIPQKLMIERLRRQAAYKQDIQGELSVSLETSGTKGTAAPALPNEAILAEIRQDTLRGGYWLVNWSGYQGYDAGDNVVQIVVMGALVVEAVEASDALLTEGIFADVLVVPSPDELLGPRAATSNYQQLQQRLGMNGMPTADGSRIPVVAICDGEPGFLDNIGSIIGVVQQTLGTIRHSKCGRPSDIYRYHGLDSASIRDACVTVLEQSAQRDCVT